MNFLVLAAGKGSRLGDLTKTQPKPLVKLWGKPLLDYQLAAARTCGLNQHFLVTGYCSEAFLPYNTSNFHNNEFASSNMLYSLMCARELFNSKDDLIISYGDIVYTPGILKQLIDNPNDFVVSADLHWRNLWELRMENPLSDAESFKFDNEQRLYDIGQPLQSYSDAQAQYIGLIKIRAAIFNRITTLYDAMEESSRCNAYFTDFIQLCINEGIPVHSQLHKRQWLEVDTQEDLYRYEALIQDDEFEALGVPSQLFA